MDREGPLDQPVNGWPLMPGSGRSCSQVRRAAFLCLCLGIASAGVTRRASSGEEPPAGVQPRTDSAASGTQLAPEARPAAQEAASGVAATGSAAPEAIDRQPYRIELHLSFDPSARIDQACRAILLRQWQAQVRRFVGPPWIITIAAPPSPLASGNLDRLDGAACSRFDPSFDKIWLVRISAASPAAGLLFSGREYDTATRQAGASPGAHSLRSGRRATRHASFRTRAIQPNRLDHRRGGRPGSAAGSRRVHRSGQPDR